MTHSSRFASAVVIATAMVAGDVSPALAQSSGLQRAVSGLFGASSSSSTVRQKLDFNFSLIEAHDSDVPAELSSRVGGTKVQLGGYSTMLIAAADYARQRPRTDFGATVGSALRYYSRRDEIKTVSHNAGIGLTTRLPGQTTVSINQAAAYRPSYFYQLFPAVTDPRPGDAITIAPDYQVDRSESYAYGTSLRVARGSSRGNSVAASGEFNHTEFQRQDVIRPDVTTYGAGADFSHGVARTGGFSVGYRYRTGEFGRGRGPTTEHTLHIGLNFAPAISVTRRAMFRFYVASSTLDTRQSTDLAVMAGRRYRVVGDLEGSYLFRRTWMARAKYGRAVQYLAVLGEPIVADGASMGLDGFFTYRLNLSLGAGYSSGKSALRRYARNFDTYRGDVSLRYAWTRSVGVFAEYLYYFYDFRRSLEIARGFPPSLERNGVRVGLAMWVPAIGR